MSHISDARYDALRAQFPNLFHTNDLLFAWAEANGGSGNTLNDRIYSMLIAQGADPLQVNDMWAQVLAANGFEGQLNDQKKQFWDAGGTFSGSTEDNYLLDATNLDEYLLDNTNTDDVYLLDGAPFFVPQDADQYVLNQDSSGPLGLIFRYDMRWHPLGTRVWMRHGGTSHPAFDSLYQYDVSVPWSLNTSFWTLTGSLQIGNDNNNRTISWVNNGTRLVFLAVWFAGFRRMDSFAVGTPYDINTLGAADGAFTGLIGNEFGMEWSSDYTKVLVQRLGGTWNRYNAAVPGDLNTLSGPDQTWDSAATDGVNTDTLAFAPGELKMYSLNSTLLSWDLAAPFSISPAPSNFNTGVAVDLPTNMQVARGLNINPGTGELFAMGDQNAYRLRSWTA